MRLEQMNTYADEEREIPITLFMATVMRDGLEWGVMVSLNGHDQELPDAVREELEGVFCEHRWQYGSGEYEGRTCTVCGLTEDSGGLR